MESFSKEKLINLRKAFPKKEDFDLVRKKLPFPYGYMNDKTKLLAPLPKIWECVDSLTAKRMEDKTYARLEKNYKHFKCKNMGDLQKIYLKVDCTLLADAMETNRAKNIEEEGLDPPNYLSLPHLSFDSMLKLTMVELDLFSPGQADMHTLFKNNRREGFTTCPTRYAKANHKYIKTYDPSKPSVFLMAFDINGMYSSVPEDYLPVRDYKDLEEEEFDNWEAISEEEGKGLFLVVDVEYPLKLDDEHNSFPVLPKHLNGRLDAHLWDRKEIGVRYKALKEAIKRGLILG